MLSERGAASGRTAIGVGWAFRTLPSLLGADQPVYALQAAGQIDVEFPPDHRRH